MAPQSSMPTLRLAVLVACAAAAARRGESAHGNGNGVNRHVDTRSSGSSSNNGLPSRRRGSTRNTSGAPTPVAAPFSLQDTVRAAV